MWGKKKIICAVVPFHNISAPYSHPSFRPAAPDAAAVVGQMRFECQINANKPINAVEEQQ